VLKGLAHFFVHETCGKCVPCRVGTTQIHAMLTKIAAGNALPADLERLEELGRMIKNSSLCGLGLTAANPVLTALEHIPLLKQVPEAH
jgi:bidirectional [NiFe] hydrogenase diaphorase subunit